MAEYVLNEQYLLRGWDKLPYAVVDASSGKATFMLKQTMETLLLCDGTHDLDTPFIPEQTKRELSNLLAKGVVRKAEGATLQNRQRYICYPNRFVSSAHWALTGKCNFRCRHCYMSAPHAALGELSHETLIEIVRQIGACGIPAVSLTGGEPLLRRDFFELVDALLEQNVTITQLYTNGALLTDAVLDGLEQRGQKPLVVISYDGVGWHDWIRGVRGAQEATDRAFELCRQHGLIARAQMAMHKGSIQSLRETVLHLKRLGCAALRVNCVDNVGEWLNNNEGQTITMQEFFEAALAYLPAYYEDGMPLPLTIANFFSATPSRPDEYHLMAYRPGGNPDVRPLFACARQALLINADGKPAICDSLDSDYLGALPIASDNPEAETLSLSEQLMTGSPYMERMDLRCRDLKESDSACSACPYLSACWGGCHAVAYRSCGNVMGADPTGCLFFKQGYAERIIEEMHRIRPSAHTEAEDDPLFSSK